MFKFFFFLTGIYTSTNNGSICTTESVASNMNDFYIAKRRKQCNQISTGNNNTSQFPEQENFKLGKIIDNTLDLGKELQPKSTQSSVLNNPIFDTMNSQCFQAANNEILENPVIKKLKLDDNSKCITSENARHPKKIFQNSSNIYYSSTSNRFKPKRQYDGALNPDKAINDQNDNIKCEEIITYKDKKDLMNKLYDFYAKKFNVYLISKKNLNYNSAFQNETVQFNNQQSTNLDLFLDFYREALSRLKSAFDKAKNEQISILNKGFILGNKDKKFIFELSKFKRCYCTRKRSLNTSIERQIKNI